ncbi:MAG: ABC transporter ATP-binding protein [Paludibacteraceae bacterium]|nr:ABC transporter ATP-binding protein [Prevotellaceae bacterium]
MIRVSEIWKSYGKTDALRGISFSVNRGEIFGLIGPDGAGKTTLFHILTTLMLADRGHAEVAGHDVVEDFREIRRCVGYMPGRFSLYQDLTVRENLELFASVFGTDVQSNYGLIEEIYRQIEPFNNRLAAKLSGGMKQKLALCCALIHAPEVLFLDEPTTGVDPTSRKEFWQMLRRLKEKGITILVSTPYMDEATLCDRIALIQKGNILQTDTPAQMVRSFGHPLFAISSVRRYDLLLAAREYPEILRCYSFGETHHLLFRGTPCPDIFKQAMRMSGFDDIEISPVDPTIEDCFIQLTSL